MTNFKESPLCEKLYEECFLNDPVYDFLDACSDDWTVEESTDYTTGETTYTLATEVSGYYGGKERTVTAVYTGDLNAMALLMVHLEWVNRMVIEELFSE